MGSSLRVTTGRRVVLLSTAFLLMNVHALPQTSRAPHSFELMTHRMDVDVDGAPKAYGPPGTDTLDYPRNAHSMGHLDAPVVGYMTENAPPHQPIVQGPNDPAPGYYVSQTAYEDESNANERDPRRYVDATAINYVVLGDKAHEMGARLGDLVAVYSLRTHRSVFGIVGDNGNPSGNEGSLHLLQALGYPFHNGKNDAVEEAEIVIRFYPGSNPRHRFFRTQTALDKAAEARGLSREFNPQTASRAAPQ
jgi:Fungal chitosanase of glycosyl hydrolase group 75